MIQVRPKVTSVRIDPFILAMTDVVATMRGESRSKYIERVLAAEALREVCSGGTSGHMKVWVGPRLEGLDG